MSDAIELAIEPRVRPVGNGEVRRLLPFRERRMVGPFIFADIMGPDAMGPGQGMDVDAHPHIGLATVTYLLRGRALHRDSAGSVQTIEPGAVNWMTAGSGITHTERSLDADRDATFELFGLQTWVALPTEAEDGPAGFEHCAAADVASDTSSGATVRLAVGTGFGMEAPITGASPLILAEMTLDAGTLTLEPDHRERAVVVLDGDVALDGHRLDTANLAVLRVGSRPKLTGSGTAMVLGGEPVGDRRIWWNFVHSNPDVIEEAKRRWTEQRFPTVPDDHDPWVPLPSG